MHLLMMAVQMLFRMAAEGTKCFSLRSDVLIYPAIVLWVREGLSLQIALNLLFQNLGLF